ncbi:MAG: oxygen-independent coproporphyrinogen III oxidase [Deltaproteobacteria bacterium]|nr:oxygen-independent coproporphyrinogen III oxidase [Deltaproteobacteria bacterium]
MTTAPAALPELTPELLNAYDRPGPRYTSYPTADRFGDGFSEADYVAALARANAQRPGEALSVYTHLPFCEALCTYCGCNVTVSRSAQTRARYLARLAEEIARVVRHLPDRRLVSQLHLGGGTPNAYADDELAALFDLFREHFELAPDAEVAIEADPRHATPERLARWREIGINRLSMGVQDFDPAVQERVGRVCPPERVEELVAAARAARYDSVNLDLIYGLPRQTAASFARTVARVIGLRPDRVALYSFAWVPWAKPHQAAFEASEMPDRDAKIALFCDARKAFLDAGYEAIGMDHFALPSDELAVAQREGRLRRNFQGYTAMRVRDVVAFGVSAIGDIGGAYIQNTRSLHAYNKAIDGGGLATARGLRLSDDDEVRRYAIHELMCRFRLDDAALRRRFGAGVADLFGPELATLAASEDLAPLAEATAADGVRVSPLGQLFVRNVAAVFDRYLQTKAPEGPLYSRMV